MRLISQPVAFSPSPPLPKPRVKAASPVTQVVAEVGGP